jgi:hypothetical protein
MRNLARALSLMSLVTLMVACDGIEDPGTEPLAPVPTPTVESLSTLSAAVGDEITINGSGFIAESEGYTEITMRGVYHHDGISDNVNITVPVSRLDANTLRWRFGPYRIPFTATGNQLGTFEGEVFATNYSHDGRERRQDVDFQEIAFDVRPSLVVREVTAAGDDFESDCNIIGTRLINFVPYRLSVEAVGFRAEEFYYSVAGGLLSEEGPSESRSDFFHEAASNIDSLGINEALTFAEVPMGVPVYSTSISATAYSETGEQYEQFIMLTVHQPIFVRYRGGVELAEIMEPVPITGCIPGGMQGRQLTYSESVSETRTLSTSHSFSQGWQNSYTEAHTETYGESGSEANKIGYSSSDQNNWNWNVNGQVMVGGEAGVPLVTKGKVEVRVGGGRDWGGSHTDTESGETAWSQTASFTEALSLTEQHSETINEAFTEVWTVSSSESELRGYSVFLIPNHFGVWFRQTTRNIRRAEIIAMDLCGNETVVGEMIMNDYTWAVDLAMGTECPPYPESMLPVAQCVIPPCEEIE